MNTLRTSLWPLALTALLLLSQPLPAQEAEEGSSEILQDFFLLDSVYPQEHGEWQLALAPSVDRGDEEDVFTTEVSVEYGISDRLQIEGELPYVTREPEKGEAARGLGDVELGVLYALRKPLRPLAVSAGIGAILPTGDEDEELGEGRARGGPFVLLARQIGAAQVHGGLALRFGGGSGIEGGLAAVLPKGRWRLTLELAGEAEDDEEDTLRLAPGLLFHLGEGSEIGLALAAGLTPDTPDWGVFVRGVWSFEPGAD